MTDEPTYPLLEEFNNRIQRNGGLSKSPRNTSRLLWSLLSDERKEAWLRRLRRVDDRMKRYHNSAIWPRMSRFAGQMVFNGEEEEVPLEEIVNGISDVREIYETPEGDLYIHLSPEIYDAMLYYVYKYAPTMGNLFRSKERFYIK